MKAMKIALLGTAALAAVSVSARADQLSDLKAQIEALNARVASIETTPALPAGYKAVTFSKVGNDHVISIMPTADLPASTTITWSGYVRAAVLSSYKGNIYGNSGYYSTDVVTRAYLTVEGKTDTAVGEVGAKVKFMENSYGSGEFNGGHPGLTTDGYWGWWKMTPNLTLGGGVDGSLAKSSYGLDNCANCFYTSTGGPVGQNNPGDASTMFDNHSADPSQIRLSYADGPLSFAVALEDGANGSYNTNSAFGVAGKIGYAADSFAVDIEGGYWGNPDTAYYGPENAWSLSAGAKAGMGMFSIQAAVGMFSGFYNNDNQTRANVLLTANLSDSIYAEGGVSHTWNTQTNSNYDATTFEAGLYYQPVNKLTIGVEGSYTSLAGGSATTGDGAYVADLVSVWKF